MRSILLALLLMTVSYANAAEPVKVRFGMHDHFDRLVFEFPVATSFELQQGADTAVLHFANGGDIPSLRVESPTVKSVVGGTSVATVSLTPGTQISVTVLDRRVILDARMAETRPHVEVPKIAKTAVLPGLKHLSHEDAVSAPQPAAPNRPSTVSPMPTASTPAPSTPAPATPAPSTPAPSTPAPSVPTASVVPAEASAKSPPDVIPATPNVRDSHAPSSAGSGPIQTQPPEPISISALPAVAVKSDPDGSAMLLPFGRDVGAAAFPRASEAWVVFDEQRPFDAVSFKDQPAFSDATVQVFPTGTLLRIPHRGDQTLSLRRTQEGWLVRLGHPNRPSSPLLPVVQANRILLPADNTGRVVTFSDPQTGQNLEVATLRTAGPGVPVMYSAPEFSILPSWQGVVVEPLSDRVTLHNSREGAVIDTGAVFSAAAESAHPLADAAVLTRRYDFPALPVPSLLRRLQAQMVDEGAAPAQDRLATRKLAAQTMLALGLGPEAQSLLKLAEADDPRAADDADFQGLSGIAALLSDRPNEADGLLRPELNGNDEISLWRAVLAASRQEGSPEAAALFAATTNLILSYPAALRDRLLPLAAETMAAGGAKAAADALIAKLPNEPRLALARAIRLDSDGDATGALTLYDALASNRDRLVSARAAARAVRLRLANHMITPAEAADQLERHLLDWRGDNRERDLRLEVVDLRAEAGQWRQAFNLLKETAALYPDDAAKFRVRTTELLTKLLRDDKAKSISPLDLVTLAEENAEAAAQAAPDDVTALLADKLAALDLPNQAAPIFERMLSAAPSGIARAALGARLASVRLEVGKAAEADAALKASDYPDLPAALKEQRALLAARCRAQMHDVAGATAILAGLDTTAADDLRATILATAGDWRGSEAALKSMVNRVVPASGPLTTEQQDLLLRLASAQARAGDDEGARELGNQDGVRMSGPRNDMFRLLTAAPVNGVADLPRSAGELVMARAIPAGVAAFGSH